MGARLLKIEVVYAVPERYWSVALSLAEPATVAEALAAAALADKIPDAEIADERLAIFGRKVTPMTRLHDGDRIEILRPLLNDPKQARRERAEQGRSGRSR